LTNLKPTFIPHFKSIFCSRLRNTLQWDAFSRRTQLVWRSVSNSIFAIQRRKRGPIVRPFEATPSYTEFLGELIFSTFKDMGCDRILFVKGANDVKAVQQLLRLFGKEHTTVILPLG
jgi:hypothetical protein